MRSRIARGILSAMAIKLTKALLAMTTLLALPATSPALTPGPELPVNATTALTQQKAAIVTDPGGGFTVAWESHEQDGDGSGIFARRFAGSGTPLGGEIAVNVVTAGHQYEPAIAVDGSGGFTVAWASPDASNFGIFARRFNANGAPVTGEIPVNAQTANRQYAAAIAPAPGGGFVVAWQSEGQDGSGNGVYARRFAANGAPLGGEVAVNTTTFGQQLLPAIAPDPGGGFTVAWQSDLQDGDGVGIIARRFGVDGDPLTGEIAVNASTTNHQRMPAIAPDGAGGFTVAWQSDAQDGDGTGVFARRFDSEANPLTANDIRVNSFVAGSQIDPAIASDPGGGFTVAWQSPAQDGDRNGVFARRFAPTGDPLTAEIPVNTTTVNYQNTAAIAADGTGGFTVAWQSVGQDGDGLGVFARRFVEPPPAPGPPAPPPAPPAPPASAPPAPRADRALGLAIAGKRLTVNRRGVARLRLRCAAGEASPPCQGKVVLRTQPKLPLGKGPKAKKRRIVLARASFRIPAGRAKAVKLRLGKAKLRLLKRNRRARKAQAIVRARDGAGNRRTLRKGLVLTPWR